MKNSITEPYVPYGKEWEAELSKLPKAEIIKLLRKEITGTKDAKLCGIETLHEAQYAVEGILNDFEAGLSDKDETLNKFREYTGRLMGIFWENAKKQIKANPELLND